MALYIFSDAHLGSANAEKEAVKVARIRELFDLVKKDGDRLVILGDLFDFWFEYKHAIPKDHHRILFWLTELVKSGLTIDYISGNHDFWMGDFFTKDIGVNLHENSLNIEYAGKKLHLIHGDGLAPGDWAYHIMKKVLRNPMCIWLYRKLPPDWAIPLAKKVSSASRGNTARREHHFAKDYEHYAQTKLDEGFDIVFIGHLHLPVYQKLDNGLYINTGDFINHFSYARVNEDKAELLYLEPHASST